MPIRNYMNRKIVFMKAVLTNMIAGLFPKGYMWLTRETGRGGELSSPSELETYSEMVITDYQNMLEKTGVDFNDWIKEKIVLEYGPGDFLGAPLLFIAKGAKRVCCTDRFPLLNDEKYQSHYDLIIDKHFRSDLDKKWKDIINKDIMYSSSLDGTIELQDKVDLIISRAVLEHCNDLPKTFESMDRNLKSGGFIVHKVDLTSHSEHYQNEFEFLCYSKLQWRMMTSFKGLPNRFRRNTYLELLDKYNFKLLYSKSVNDFSSDELSRAKDELSDEFRNLDEKDLFCSDFFFIAQKP